MHYYDSSMDTLEAITRSLQLGASDQSPETAESRSSCTNPALHLTAQTWPELEYLIDNCPLIDNHAHALLKKLDCKTFEKSGTDLLQVLSEANSDALKHVPNTLAYHRAFNALRSHAGPIRDWDDWKTFRDNTDETKFTNACLNGLQTILIDDGLRCPGETSCHDINWHNQFLKSPAKRIVRLETVAEDLIADQQTFYQWNERYTAAIREMLLDPEVAGFKSVIGYRSGLEVTRQGLDEELQFRDIAAGYDSIKSSGKSANGGYIIKNRTFNSHIVWVLATEMANLTIGGCPAKPLQFHTGFGDSDIYLEGSNPLLLQSFIEEFPSLPIVLLHASYPFTREAGWLASTYNNVYLDFGLIWPKLSQQGQEAIVKQVLELTPSSKAMWSTDGAFYGETFYLAIRQSREVLKTVMKEINSNCNISVESLANIVTDLLFNTANRVYNLDLVLRMPPPAKPLDAAKGRHIGATPNYINRSSLQLLKGFLAKNPKIEYIRLNWFDYSAILRTRVLKLKHVIKQLEENEDGSVIGVAKAALYLLVNCHLATGGGPAGEWRLVPEFTSIRLHPHKREGETDYNTASVMCWIRDDDGKPVNICPRNILARALDRAAETGLSDFKIGFEIEFCMLKLADLDCGDIVPISKNHTWSTSSAFRTDALKILEDIDKNLAAAGIEIEQFHSEAAPGQYELVLSPLPPMQAADTLLHTREVMQYVCRKYGYAASVLPKPFEGECGTASHMHLSFKPVRKQWSFFAGLLREIRAVSAMTLGGRMSYERVIDGYWAGGIWACWGRQNREAPLRLVEEKKAHWEIKCVDGLANTYLAIAGVITAGSIGVDEGLEIYGEAAYAASNYTEEERQKRGITTKMTKTISEATAALFQSDGETPTKFAEALGPGVAEHLRTVRQAEEEHLFPGTSKQIHRELAAQWY